MAGISSDDEWLNENLFVGLSMNAEFGDGRGYLVHFQRRACERLNSSWISDKSSIGVLVAARSARVV